MQNQTPAQKAGYVIGDKFEVMSGFHFERGTIVTFVEDDGSDVPLFEANGERHYKLLSNLKPLPKTTVTEGQEYTIINDVGYAGRYFRAGERVKALESGSDDDSLRFISVDTRMDGQADGSTSWWVQADNVKPAPEQTRAERAGLKIGTRVLTLHPMYGIPHRVLAELSQDDRTDMPAFRVLSGARKGDTMYFHLSDVEVAPLGYSIDPEPAAKQQATSFVNSFGDTIIAISGAVSPEKLAAINAILAI